MLTRISLFLTLCALALPAWAQQSLQTWIDLTPPGGVLRLPPGTYRGPALIEKPLTLEGNGKVVVDGGGRGTVITIKADNVTLRGLHLKNSGDSHDAIDGGIMGEGKNLLIEHNQIDDVLFGISLHKGGHSTLRHNRIRSRHSDSADRGDGLRLWYSHSNLIAHNDFSQIRDLTISNATDNRFKNNHITDSRRAFNFLFAHRSVVEDNHLEKNSTGIIALNSEHLLIRGNRILHAMDASGAGIALKETSAAIVVDNEIVHCAHGLMADSPMDPYNRIVMVNNLFAHNLTAIYFYGAFGGHIAIANTFRNNLWPVSIVGDGDPMNDLWLANYWDDYQGFDRNHDGYGDWPHELLVFADRLWMEIPATKFFRNAIVLELLDFLERLAPFSSPMLILHDAAPRMQPWRGWEKGQPRDLQKEKPGPH
ncbi:MAG: nitrous oxide reductase family maturation protein NosD [Azonexus sp.]|jgi:nitrous oxidase accessory protein|nr:nitrous oxide reductase family maturation protein NosD [Azonexus sp.]